VDARPESQLLMRSVRSLLVRELGQDMSTSGWGDFNGIAELAFRVVRESKSGTVVQSRAYRVFQGILPSLFLGWVPPLWRFAVSGRAPQWAISASFAGVFQSLFPWLMGPMRVHNHTRVGVPLTDGTLSVGIPDSIEAERCRFLEETGCASVCVHACKVPSQRWLKDDFGIDVHVQPNYEDFSCVWEFGKQPPPIEEDEAMEVPCFPACPTASKSSATLEQLASRASEEAQEDAVRVRRRVAQEAGTCKQVDTVRGER
jgi:hypothetical protein